MVGLMFWRNEWMIILNRWYSKAKNFFVSLQNHHPVCPVGISESTPSRHLPDDTYWLPQPSCQNKGRGLPISSSFLTIHRGPPLQSGELPVWAPCVLRGVGLGNLFSHLSKLLRSWMWADWQAKVVKDNWLPSPHGLSGKYPTLTKSPCSLYSWMRTQMWFLPREVLWGCSPCPQGFMK